MSYFSFYQTKKVNIAGPCLPWYCYSTYSDYHINYGDDYQSYSMNFEFNYFSTVFNQITLNSNGYILFNSLSGCCTGEAMIIPSNSISLFNIWFNYCYYGYIYYQIATSSDLILIQDQLNQYGFNNFTPQNAFIVTFDGMENDNGEYANFQVILSTDSYSSFVTICYDSCSSTPSYLTTPGLYYMDLNGQQNIYQMIDPCTSSNVGLNSLWIFNVTLFGLYF